jgi:apolipoprotein N-acyltransferase
MLPYRAYLFSFLIGITTAAVGNFSHAAWWQMLLMAIFWRQIHQHHYHGLKTQITLGWLFGLGYFCQGIWWLYVSMHDVGGMPSPMAAGGVVVLAGFLALFPTLAVALGARFYNQSNSAIAWASAWTIAEWLRGNILTGFPWIGFGDAQINGPFQGLIPIFGVLGATFATIWGAYKIGSAPGRIFLPLFSLGFAIAICSLFEGVEFTKPVGKMLEVRLFQGNFPQTLHYDPVAINNQNNYYFNGYLSKAADLTVGPETAITVPENLISQEWEKNLQTHLNDTKGYVLTGLIGINGDQYSNRAKAYGPDGEIYTYDKSHLVPFGEYIPPGFEWFIRAIRAPLSQFTMGTSAQPHLKIKRGDEPDISAALMICYEDVFGAEIAQRIRKFPESAPNMLINLTNLAWFGDTSAPWQHLRLAQLRSLETGLPTIRATNTGVTAIINDKGKVVSQLPVFSQGVLTGSVQARSGITPYVQFGDMPILVLSLITLVISWRKKKLITPLGTQTRII